MIVTLGRSLAAQPAERTTMLDSFDSGSQWTTSSSPGVETAIHLDPNGLHGRALRLDFDFHGNRGYALVRRSIELALPPEYAFSFAIRGAAPTNTLEFKLVELSGAGVWWSNNPDFEFPQNWTPVSRNRGQIPYAWGSTRDREIRNVSAIEFAITAGSGGKGSVWLDDLAITTTSSPALGSIALSILLLAAGAAFTRAPLLRRRLLALGTPRYTEPPTTSGERTRMAAIDSASNALGGGPSARDSLIVWILVLASPVLAIGFLGRIWPQLPGETWGAGLIALGIGALAYSKRKSRPDPEIAHVALTAAVLWTMIGLGRVVPNPESLPAWSLLAALVVSSLRRPLAGPRGVAKLAVAFALSGIVDHELSIGNSDTGALHLRWLLSELITLGAGAFVAMRLIAEKGDEKQGIGFSVATYLTALVVVWSALDPIWPPLVTASYAGLGAVILILSRRDGAHVLLKYLGAVTMLIVVGRLLLVDLSRVEPIWRVLLFIVVGALFLYTGYRMRPQRPHEP